MLLIKDLKKQTWKNQKIEIWAYPNTKTGFEGIGCRIYVARRIPKKYDDLKIVYWASEYRADVGSILIVDCVKD